jgi:hypothetical protein
MVKKKADDLAGGGFGRQTIPVADARRIATMADIN